MNNDTSSEAQVGACYLSMLPSPTATSSVSSADDLIQALGNIGDAQAIPTLRERMAHASAREQADIRRARAHLEHDDPVPALLALLHSEPESISKTYVIWDLIESKDARAIDAFAEIVRTADDPPLRYQAMRGLGAVGSRQTIAALVGLFNADFSTLEPFIQLAVGPKSMVDDPTAYFHARIADQLRHLTNEELGDDPDGWRDWLKVQ